MKKYENIARWYDSECLLKHKHRIKVRFELKNETFTIDKEHPATQEDWDETEKDIIKLLNHKSCEFCDKKVERAELAGFSHEAYNTADLHKKPICQACWNEYKARIEHKDEYYSSLDDYYRTTGLIGNEEIENCSILVNYPKSGKEKDPIFNEFDLKQIAKFKEEVNTEILVQKNKLYGNLTDEQKFFILEYLCHERNNYSRESQDYAEFQVVIESLRKKYRQQADKTQNEDKQNR